MAFLLSASNHHPYQLPKGYRELDLGELEGTLLGDYLHSVHYFDQAFGEFVDKLRDVGLLDKSVILLYVDHQGFLGDPPQLARLLGYSERDAFRTLLVRKNVPLLIRLPQKQAAGMRAVAGGHLDIAPTLLSLLGIIDDKKVMLGSDLTKEEGSLVVFRDGIFIDGKYYFDNRLGPVSTRTCYEVKTGQIIDCEHLKVSRRRAIEQLEISDTIIRANLICLPYRWKWKAPYAAALVTATVNTGSLSYSAKPLSTQTGWVEVGVGWPGILA